MITKIEGKCQYEGCDQPATHIACGRKSYDPESPHHENAGVYCEPHANDVSGERWPEYTADCPNCGCVSGVN